MKKILDYFYIFSKLSTSFILLLLLLFLCYFFYLGFNNQKKQDNDKVEFLDKINENSKQLLIFSEKFQKTNSSINNIIEILKTNNNIDQTNEIKQLNKKIAKLSSELQSIDINLQKIQTSVIKNENNNIENSNSDLIINKNKSELTELILFKFENSLDFNQELIILQNLHNENQKYIFEKISLVKDQNYRGNIFLKNLFTEELDNFLKNGINSSENNFIKNSLMKFIVIEPSKKNTIKDNDINHLKEINSLLAQKKYKDSYQKMININNYENFFNGTLHQLKIAIEFKNLIKKVS